MELTLNWHLTPGDDRAIRQARRRFTDVLARSVDETSDVEGATLILGTLLAHLAGAGRTHVSAVVRERNGRLELEMPHVRLAFASAAAEPLDPLAAVNDDAFFVRTFSDGIDVVDDGDGTATVRVALRCRLAPAAAARASRTG